MGTPASRTDTTLELKRVFAAKRGKAFRSEAIVRATLFAKFR
jgi:hypothetical protein